MKDNIDSVNPETLPPSNIVNPRVKEVFYTVVDVVEKHTVDSIFVHGWFSYFDEHQKDGSFKDQEKVPGKSTLEVLELMTEKFGSVKMKILIISSFEKDAREEGVVKLLCQVYSLFLESCYDTKTGLYSKNLAENASNLPMEWLIEMVKAQEKEK